MMATVVLLVIGLYALITGKLRRFGAALKYEVRGWPARFIGVFCLLPIPLSVAAGFVASMLMAAQGKDLADESNVGFRIAIDWVTLLVFRGRDRPDAACVSDAC